MKLTRKEKEKIHRQFVENKPVKERLTWVGYPPVKFVSKRRKAQDAVYKKEISKYC